MSNDKREATFNKLRALYIKRKKQLDEYSSDLRSRYGADYSSAWLKRAESKKLDQLRDAITTAEKAFFAYLESVSPRDWSYGVPVYWVCESLTFADATRPTSEQLSVVPPMAYGASRPRT